MLDQTVPLAELSELQRTQAYTRFTIIRPVLEDGVSQAHVARIHNVPASTVQRWVSRYRTKGIAGLADAERSDKGTSRRLQQEAIGLVEKLALQSPQLSVAAIHRQITAIAREQEWDPPSYARVRQVIQGFIPSSPATALSSGRHQLIGMLIPSFTWPLIPEIMRGVAQVLDQTSYELVLYSINDTDLERDRSEVINRVLATQLTAGLLAVFPGPASKDLTRLYRQGFPVVIVDDQLEQTTPWVGVDNKTGAYMVVRHLIQLGHRRIAHIAGPHEYLASHDRFNGYRQALLEASIPLNPELVLEGNFLPPSGRACARKFFQLPPEKRPTAIFAATDEMAYGVLAAAEEYGIAIPQDLALVGFDDDEASVHVRPPLTTVRQPYYEMGAQGLKLLLSLLDPTQSATNKRIHLEEETSPRIQLSTSLIVRASCGAYHQNQIPQSSSQEVI